MTTLLERCRIVTTKIEKLTLERQHANQQQQVQQRTREWRDRYATLKAYDELVASFVLTDLARKRIDEKRSSLRSNAVLVLERLISADDISQLTEDASWSRLLACLDGLIAELQEVGGLAWRAYIDEVGSLEAPSLLRSRAPSTPSNESAIKSYSAHYSVYSNLIKSTLPKNPNDLEQLTKVVAGGREAASLIQFNVSPEVQAFFNDIQSGSATLASVTPSVLEWLKENGQLEHYKIRSVVQ